MIIKRGSIVSHVGAIQWGVGKVIELAELKATIQFSDGVIRKIASSHYSVLQAGDPAAFVPVPESVAVVKVRVARKKKIIQPGDILQAADAAGAPRAVKATVPKARKTRQIKSLPAAIC
jgi:hypothetical protein